MRLARPVMIACLVLALAAAPARAATLGVGVDAPAVSLLPADALSVELDGLGATWVRVDARWDAIAPTRPARPRLGGDRAYRWGPLDRLIRRIVASRVAAGRPRPKIIIAIAGTPSWARADGIDAPDAAALPRPAAFGDFVRALARRYRASASAYEIWPEPNRATSLAPQRIAGRLVSPAVLGRLVRAAAAVIVRTDPSPVIAGGVARGADPNAVTPPRAFLRALGRIGLPRGVAGGVRLAPSGPEEAVASADDLTLADGPTVMSAVAAAFRGPSRSVWVTGYGVSSAAGAAAQAEGVAALRAMAVLPRVRCAVWDRLVDGDAPGVGLLDATGAPKPAELAWRSALG